MILRDHEDSENSIKRKSPSALSAHQRRRCTEPEHYAPDATRGCMEDGSLNIDALFYII
jgi:hypothetical protein